MREVAKSQWVRAYNVVFMCPYMMYLGRKHRMDGWAGVFMSTVQWITLLFNLRNLIQDWNKPKRYYRRYGGMSTLYEHPEDQRREAATVQFLRWGDILLYGPMCIAITRRYKLKGFEKLFLDYTGLSTIALNGANYLANREVLAEDNPQLTGTVL